MNYIQIFKDSIRLIRTTKLVWFFGLLSQLLNLISPLFQFVRNNTVLECLYIPVLLAVSVISLISEGSLIYSIHQASLNKSSTISEVWLQGKSRVLSIIGLSIIVVPAILIAVFFIRIVVLSSPISLFFWLVVLLSQSFIGSLFIFGICAIMIDDIKAGAAAWTSFLITINNFFRVLVITGGIFFIRLFLIGLGVVILVFGFGLKLPTPLTLTYLTYQELINIPILNVINLILSIILVPFTSVILSLGYLRFSKEIAYPTLVKKQEAA